MDLIVTDSDFSTILADVTITHPNPLPTKTSPSQCYNKDTSLNSEYAQRSKYNQVATAIGAKFLPLASSGNIQNHGQIITEHFAITFQQAI